MHYLYLPIIITLIANTYAPVVYAADSVLDEQPPVPVRIQQLEESLFAVPSSKTNRAQAVGNGDKLLEWQDAWRLSTGRYEQMLWTNDIAPITDTRQIYLNLRPDTATHTPREIFAMAGVPDVLPYRLKINVYSAPCGDGLELVAEAVADGYVWRRTRNYGCEDYRENPWEAIQPSSVITR